MRYRQRAICLKTTDYSETSQVVTFLTDREGVVRLIAKGVKRPKSKAGGALDLLAEGDLLYSLRNPQTLGTLMEFSESASRGALRAESRRLNAGLYCLEAVEATLAEGDPHPEVFDLLSRSLRRLAEPDAPLPAVLAWFQWRLLRHLGLLGQMTVCVDCGEELDLQAGSPDVAFSSRLGGLLCEGCQPAQTEKTPLGEAARAALGALATAQAGRKTTLPDNRALAANRLLSYHLAHQLGRPLRMTRYVLGKTDG
jgi:DNA repair protein RecO (recombination protein O)